MGAYIVVDGMDGSGKGSIIQGFIDWSKEKGYKILELHEFCAEHNRLPEPSEIDGFDVIFSDEPTDAYIGRAIREEMILDNKRDYSVQSTSWAFALDRELLFNRVIIPALKMGKLVFQDRGIASSLVYQPVQGRITLRELMEMPGNRLALKHSPGLLIITKVDPKVVIERLQIDGRIGGAIFRNLNFQRTIEERYSSTWLKSLFERFGTRVEYIDTNPPKSVEQTRQEAIALLDGYLASQKRQPVQATQQAQ